MRTVLSEDYLIVSDPAICGGKPVVRGTRVPVQYILELWERGYSVEDIHEQYPTVPKEIIKKVIEYLAENKVFKITQ
ncbi:hypothetical protein HRbin01_01102 [archaeon HR01]|nr:hypothetical protein HRbin01_01102 [archaeon HR01]